MFYDIVSKPNDFWVLVAAQEGKLDVLKFLESKGADLSTPDNDGTPRSIQFFIFLWMTWFQVMLWVYFAAKNGHLHCVRWLIEKGVNLDQTDDAGRSAGLKLDSRFDTWFSWVWAASFKGHVDCVKVLIDNGADFSIANNNGFIPGGYSMILFQNQMICEFWLQLKRES